MPTPTHPNTLPIPAHARAERGSLGWPAHASAHAHATTTRPLATGSLGRRYSAAAKLTGHGMVHGDITSKLLFKRPLATMHLAQCASYAGYGEKKNVKKKKKRG